ncbi:MAG: CDP-diacylglycerol--glycerol-3-phosphate 3-phosphatidyltransferase [Elusimicrobiota bacterium]
MTLANKITVSRILMVIPFGICLLIESNLFRFFSLFFLIAASVSDYIDGELARKRDEVSDLGKFLDPLADKLFVVTAFVIFVGLNSLAVPSWAVILIIAREFIINGLRTLAASRGEIMAAAMVGKVKTASQLIAIGLIIIVLIYNNLFQMKIEYFITVVTAGITVYSGAVYIKQFLRE